MVEVRGHYIRFIDIGGIFYHHCLTFLFTSIYFEIKYTWSLQVYLHLVPFSKSKCARSLIWAEISFAPIIIKSVLLDSVWLCILFSFHSIHSRSICIGDVTNIRISIHSTLNVILVLESFLIIIIIIIIIFIANKTLAGKAIQYNTTLQNIYTWTT
jgi:hypothetical protein